MNVVEENIQQWIGDAFRLREKRAGLYQVIMPFFHEDGDMLDLFVEPLDNGHYRISDYGLTVMRLSYTYDLDSEAKQKVFNRIVEANRMQCVETNILQDVEPEHLAAGLMQAVQVINKVSNMKLYQREVVKNLFFEQLEEFVMEELTTFHPEKDYYPLPDQEEYKVDYLFNSLPRPLFVFGVNNADRAKLATISSLKFRNEKIPFRSIMVHENVESLTKKDLSRLLSVADKSFPSLEDFKRHGLEFFEREYGILR